jgi:hypothetical protein
MFCFSAQKNVKIASGRLLHTPTFEIVVPGPPVSRTNPPSAETLSRSAR